MHASSILAIVVLGGALAGCGTIRSDTNSTTTATGSTATAPATGSATDSTTTSSSGDPRMTASPPTVEPPAINPSRTIIPPVPTGLRTPPNARIPEVTCPTGNVVLYPQNGVTCAQARAIYQRWQAANPHTWSAADGTKCATYETSPISGQCTRDGALLFQLTRVK